MRDARRASIAAQHKLDDKMVAAGALQYAEKMERRQSELKKNAQVVHSLNVALSLVTIDSSQFTVHNDVVRTQGCSFP